MINIDLQRGIVSGSSAYISILSAPTAGRSSRACDSQALVRIDVRGTKNPVRFTFRYGEDPVGWTFAISDCSNDYGFGGNFNYSSNCASTQLINRQLRVYSNRLPGYVTEAINGNTLMKVRKCEVHVIRPRVNKKFH